MNLVIFSFVVTALLWDLFPVSLAQVLVLLILCLRNGALAHEWISDRVELVSAVRRINDRRRGLWTRMTPAQQKGEFTTLHGPHFSRCWTVSCLLGPLLTSAVILHQEQSTYCLTGQSFLDFPEGLMSGFNQVYSVATLSAKRMMTDLPNTSKCFIQTLKDVRMCKWSDSILLCPAGLSVC